MKRSESETEKQNAKFSKTKVKQTSSIIQQHKRTRRSSCTLLFTRIASPIALAPSSPMLLLSCETFRVGNGKTKRKVQQNKSEKTSSIIRQHKRTRCSSFTLLFTRIASAIALAPSSPMLLLPCEAFRVRCCKRNGELSETKVKKRQAAFSNTNAQGAASARYCSRASHRQSPWHRRHRCYCRAVKHSESDIEEGEKNAKKLQK